MIVGSNFTTADVLIMGWKYHTCDQTVKLNPFASPGLDAAGWLDADHGLLQDGEDCLGGDLAHQVFGRADVGALV